MNLNTLSKSLTEAERFQTAARKAMKVMEGARPHECITSKDVAACKRASMDLTRVLADLRQGR